MLVCFFDHQNMRALLIYTRKPVLDLLVVVSDAWSTSTFACMTKPMPLGSVMAFGVSSFPTTCPNLLAVQSVLSNCESSISGSLGSYTDSVLWYFFKYPNICSTWSRCLFLRSAKCADIMDTSKQISTCPNSTTLCIQLWHYIQLWSITGSHWSFCSGGQFEVLSILSIHVLFHILHCHLDILR